MSFPQQGGFFMPAMAQPQRFFSPGQTPIRGAGQPRWPQQPRGVPGQAGVVQHQYRSARPGGTPRMQHGGVQRPMGAAGQMIPMIRPGMGNNVPQQQGQQGQQQIPGGSSARPQGFKYAPNVRNSPQVAPVAQPMPINHQPQQQAVLIQGQEPLTTTMLTTATPEEQKQMLGRGFTHSSCAFTQTLLGKSRACSSKWTTPS
ncbi:Polyadenylate-binding protein [Caligus rogercresseyi]|uniref:Polyadenylate-binding protein n=1 Tax=Caligus rogercresseyi TaxID=217165 RepID=A0A7T8QTT0_CALRO|nr:Polyadenylate-binding protein [Caligus rogercresseyi]